MDAPDLPEQEVVEAYRVLRKVNVQLGNLWTARRELARMLAEDGSSVGSRMFTLLDVGAGSGDVARALGARLSSRTNAPPPLTLALDRNATAADLARRGGLDVIRGDAIRLPFADASIDLVTAVKLAHHFSGGALARLVGELARVSRGRVVVVDIRRHWLAYYGFIAWSRVFTRNRLVRHDGRLSVLRGFTAAELAELGVTAPSHDWAVREYASFQLALVGRRKTRTDAS
jgi:ubiquinone/menaquinone biosynthesis C-methylase UbiE